MRKKIPLILSGLVLLQLLAGCDRPADSASSSAQTVPPTAVPEPAATAPAGEKNCFACAGTGTAVCTNCIKGKVDCTGTCLRLNRGVWVHLEVAGHPPTDLWQKFKIGNGEYSAYNQNHVGHVIEVQGDKAVDIGPCPVCHGETKTPCKICAGTGRQKCLVCGGEKFVPEAWSATDNPWFNAQPDLLRLKDGRKLLGKVVSRIDNDLTIRTREGKSLNLKFSDLVLQAAK